MRNLYRLVALCALAGVVFVSCSKDDEGSSSVKDVSVLYTTETGEMVVLESISGSEGYRFSYDSQGRCTTAYYVDGKDYMGYNISYNPFTLSAVNLDDEADVVTVSASLNSSGYISKLTGSSKYDYDGDTGNCSSTVSFSYDSAGHLTQIEEKTSYTEDGYTLTWTSSGPFTWEDGDLVKAQRTFSLSISDDSTLYKDREVLTLTYGDEENKYQQYSVYMGQIAIDCALYGEFNFMLDVLSLIGLLGNGPAHLPEEVTLDDDWGTETDTFSFDLNEDGSLYYEDCTWGIEGYFNYATVGTESSDITKSGAFSTERSGAGRKRMVNKRFRSRQLLQDRFHNTEE